LRRAARAIEQSAHGPNDTPCGSDRASSLARLLRQLCEHAASVDDSTDAP